MGRPSKIRTNISRLRLLLGLNQVEFAQLLQRSPASVQSLEMGRLKLSRQLASEIARLTGVNQRWLIGNQLDEAPYDFTNKPWTPDTYRRLQAEIPEAALAKDDVVFRQRMLELAIQLCVARNLAGLRRLYRGMSSGTAAVETGRKFDQCIATLMLEHNLRPDTQMMEEIRFAEHESERKTQNALRVAKQQSPPPPID